MVGGKSLVKRTYDFATSANLVERVVLSTDSFEVFSECVPKIFSKEEFGSIPKGTVKQVKPNEFLHVRRDSDAHPMAKTISGVLDFLETVKGDDSWGKDLLLLQPTSPFRNSEELLEMVSSYRNSDFKSSASGKLLESPHPEKSFEIFENSRIKVTPEVLEKLESPRQILKKLYVFDGAYYLTSVSHILEKNSLISDETQLFSRTGWGTLNIDNAEDLELANYLSLKFNI